MIDILEGIFKDSGFESINADSFTLYFFKDKTSYWIVKEAETLDFIKEQDDLFIKAKEAAQHDQAFDKNASLVLLHKIADDSDLKKVKKQILEIEEDPYHFKKQVLIYSELAKEELDTQLLFLDFKKLLSDQENFKNYKDNYNLLSWQALLFRMAQKLPFVEIAVEKNKNLSSLFKSNKTAITTKGLDEINNRVNEAFVEKLAEDIKALTPDAVFDLLLTEEEKGNGTDNK